MKASNISDLLFNQLNYRSEKQKIITSNISNINTPDYKTKGLEFDKEVQKANVQNDLQLKLTNANHMNGNLNISEKSKFKIYEIQNLEEQNDGNNVNLDTQMSLMSKNKIIFDAIQMSIKKDSRLLRSVIESSSKN